MPTWTPNARLERLIRAKRKRTRCPRRPGRPGSDCCDTLLVSWPRDLFLNMRRAAVQPEIVVPLFLGFGVLALGARFVWMRRSRALALRDTMSAEEASPRLVQSLDRVMSAYRENDARIIGVCPGAPPGRPKLLLTDRSISPFVATASEAAIVFPRQLVATLSDQELDGVLAHELAHLRLRRPAWCASENVQLLSMLNPMAIFMASQLHPAKKRRHVTTLPWRPLGIPMSMRRCSSRAIDSRVNLLSR